MSYLLSGIASLGATCEAGWFKFLCVIECVIERLWMSMGVSLLAFSACFCVYLFAMPVLLNVDVTCMFFFNCLCTRMRVYTCASIYCFEGVYMYVCVRVLMQVYARVFMLILALSLSR